MQQNNNYYPNTTANTFQQ